MQTTKELQLQNTNAQLRANVDALYTELRRERQKTGLWVALFTILLIGHLGWLVVAYSAELTDSFIGVGSQVMLLVSWIVN